MSANPYLVDYLAKAKEHVEPNDAATLVLIDIAESLRKLTDPLRNHAVLKWERCRVWNSGYQCYLYAGHEEAHRY